MAVSLSVEKRVWWLLTMVPRCMVGVAALAAVAAAYEMNGDARCRADAEKKINVLDSDVKFQQYQIEVFYGFEYDPSNTDAGQLNQKMLCDRDLEDRTVGVRVLAVPSTGQKFDIADWRDVTTFQNLCSGKDDPYYNPFVGIDCSTGEKGGLRVNIVAGDTDCDGLMQRLSALSKGMLTTSVTTVVDTEGPNRPDFCITDLILGEIDSMSFTSARKELKRDIAFTCKVIDDHVKNVPASCVGKEHGAGVGMAFVWELALMFFGAFSLSAVDFIGISDWWRAFLGANSTARN